MSILMTFLTIALISWFIKETISFLLHCTLMGRLILRVVRTSIKVTKCLITHAKVDYASAKKFYFSTIKPPVFHGDNI